MTSVNAYQISRMIHNLKRLDRQPENVKENEAKEQKRLMLMRTTMIMVQTKTVVVYNLHEPGLIKIRP